MDILDPKTKALITAVGESPVVADNKSYNNEARSLLYTLIKEEMVTSNTDCNNISELIGRGKMLSSDSLSRSLQWTDIDLKDSDFDVPANIKPAFDKLKKSAFVKISAGSVFDADKDPDKDPDNHWQDSEMFFYDMLHKYVLNQNCPHIATLLYKKVCPDIDSVTFSKIEIEDVSNSTQITINDHFENMIISSVGEITGTITNNCTRCPDLYRGLDSMLEMFKKKIY